MIKKAVITDAGFASRYLPITKTIPKGMLPMGNKPIIQLIVEECVEAGIEDIIVVATPEGKPIYEDYFNNAVNRIRKQLASQGKEDRYKPVQEVLDFPKITVITQDLSLPYGNGSPFLAAREYLNGEHAFLALYGDDIVLGKPGAAKILIEAYEEDPYVDAIIAVQEVSEEEITKYGSVKFKQGSQTLLERLVEKPDAKQAPTLLASYGRYLFTQSIFEHLSPEKLGKDNELWTADAIDSLAQSGKVKVEKVKSKWMTTGDPDHYIEAHLVYLKHIGKLK